jgi:hypothetical protein
VDEMIRYLRAMVALQAELLELKEGAPKPEVVLHRAGIGMHEIANMLGKKYAAVAQTISRDRRAQGRRLRGPRQRLLTDGREHDDRDSAR